MEPQSFSNSSQTNVETIERVVRSRTSGTIRGLRVELVNGEIVLSGRVNTYYTKQLASNAALEAVKNVTLTNDIEVC